MAPLQVIVVLEARTAGSPWRTRPQLACLKRGPSTPLPRASPDQDSGWRPRFRRWVSPRS